MTKRGQANPLSSLGRSLKIETTNKNIFVVDDDARVLAFVSSVLEDSGYKVLRASSGTEAKELADSFPEAIHLLISDLEMPGMSGVALASELSTSRPAMRVLLISGFAGGLLVLQEGWHFLAKPFLQSELCAIVSRLTRDTAPPMPMGELPRPGA